MSRYFRFRVLVTLAVVALLAISAYYGRTSKGLPFTPSFVDTHTAMVEPIGGIALPAGLKAGDLIDIPALDPAARAALYAGGSAFTNLTTGVSYDLVIRRGATLQSVRVKTVELSDAPFGLWLSNWVEIFQSLLFAIVTLLALWQGRDRAARFIALWGFVYVFGNAMIALPQQGNAVFVSNIIAYIGFFAGRVALYGAAEAVAGDALSKLTKTLLRIGLIITVLSGFTVLLGGMWLLVHAGSAAWLNQGHTWLVAAPYIIPLVALFIAQYYSSGARKLRIQWMLWSLVPFIIGVFAAHISLFSYVVTQIVNNGGVGIGVSGILYAILRHRMVDVSVVIDKTLVYGATTTIVVGILAAVNSLALRATLGEGAGLLLQIVVPLALGIVLGKVRTYMDRTVEQVFFRRRYLAQQALKRFAKRCGHIEEVARLLDTAVAEIRRHTRAPAVALYETADEGYARLRQAGEGAYPQQLDKDDPAVVAARAERKAIDLAGLASGLGAEGCMFPIIVLGRLRGVLVCANRPGEHYASDEIKLLTRVVRDVGAAWRILRARDNEELVRALAQGTLKPAAARARAKVLEAAWVGA